MQDVLPQPLPGYVLVEYRSGAGPCRDNVSKIIGRVRTRPVDDGQGGTSFNSGH